MKTKNKSLFKNIGLIMFSTIMLVLSIFSIFINVNARKTAFNVVHADTTTTNFYGSDFYVPINLVPSEYNTFGEYVGFSTLSENDYSYSQYFFINDYMIYVYSTTTFYIFYNDLTTNNSIPTSRCYFYVGNVSEHTTFEFLADCVYHINNDIYILSLDFKFYKYDNFVVNGSGNYEFYFSEVVGFVSPTTSNTFYHYFKVLNNQLVCKTDTGIFKYYDILNNTWTDFVYTLNNTVVSASSFNSNFTAYRLLYVEHLGLGGPAGYLGFYTNRGFYMTYDSTNSVWVVNSFIINVMQPNGALVSYQIYGQNCYCLDNNIFAFLTGQGAFRYVFNSNGGYFVRYTTDIPTLSYPRSFYNNYDNSVYFVNRGYFYRYTTDYDSLSSKPINFMSIKFSISTNQNNDMILNFNALLFDNDTISNSYYSTNIFYDFSGSNATGSDSINLTTSYNQINKYIKFYFNNQYYFYKITINKSYTSNGTSYVLSNCDFESVSFGYSTLSSEQQIDYYFCNNYVDYRNSDNEKLSISFPIAFSQNDIIYYSDTNSTLSSYIGSNFNSDYLFLFNYRTYFFTSSADGYAAGKLDGLRDGEQIGYDKGYEVGYNNGDTDGYERGKLYGYANANRYTFIGLIGSVIDAPISAIFGYVDTNPNSPTYNQRIGGLLNFNLLGVNLSTFIAALFTLAVIITIIKKVV